MICLCERMPSLPVDPSSLAAQHPQSLVFFSVFIHASFALHSRGCSVWGQVRAGWSCAGACLSLTIDPFQFHFFVTNVNNMLMSECIWTILKSSEFMIFTYHSYIYIFHWIFCPFLSTLAGGRRWTPTTSSRGLPWSALKRCGGWRKMKKDGEIWGSKAASKDHIFSRNFSAVLLKINDHIFFISAAQFWHVFLMCLAPRCISESQKSSRSCGRGLPSQCRSKPW